MFQSRRLRYGHQWQLDQMASFGYRIDKKGMCHGISSMAMQAFLSKHINTFDERLFLINQFSHDKLYKAVQAAKRNQILFLLQTKLNLLQELGKNQDEIKLADLSEKKIRSLQREIEAQLEILSVEEKETFDAKLQTQRKLYFKNLSHEKQLLYSIEPYFEGVTIYHDPWYFPDLFDENTQIEKLNQDSILLTPLLASIAIEELGKIKQAQKFTGLYSEEELVIYFQGLQETLTQFQATKPIAFLLNTYSHTVMIGYDPETTQWTLLDPAALPSASFEKAGDLANNIMQAFSGQEFISFGTTAFVIDSQTDTLNVEEMALDAWLKRDEMQTMHAVTPEKALYTHPKFGSWLYTAAMRGEMTQAAALLEAGADPNVKTEENATPFSIATQRGDKPLLELMLTYHADINSRNIMGITPLIIAMTKHDLEIIDFLLKQKADPNKADDNGYTPLYIAVLWNDVATAEKLIYYGANAETKLKKDDTTPLHQAVQMGNLAMVDTLIIKAIANPDEHYATMRVDDLLELARQNDRQKQMQALITKNNSYWGQPSSLTNLSELHLAVIYGHRHIVQALLNYGADYKKTSHGITPLEFAIALGREDIVQTLELKIYKDQAESASDSPRYQAIKKFNDLQESLSETELDKEYSVFKRLDYLAQELADIVNQFASAEPRKTHRLETAIYQAYTDYAEGKQGENIIESLKKEASSISQKSQRSHDKQGFLYKMLLSQKNNLATRIHGVIEDDEEEETIQEKETEKNRPSHSS